MVMEKKKMTKEDYIHVISYICDHRELCSGTISEILQVILIVMLHDYDISVKDYIELNQICKASIW